MSWGDPAALFSSVKVHKGIRTCITGDGRVLVVYINNSVSNQEDATTPNEVYYGAMLDFDGYSLSVGISPQVLMTNSSSQLSTRACFVSDSGTPVLNTTLCSTTLGELVHVLDNYYALPTVVWDRVSSSNNSPRPTVLVIDADTTNLYTTYVQHTSSALNSRTGTINGNWCRSIYCDDGSFLFIYMNRANGGAYHAAATVNWCHIKIDVPNASNTVVGSGTLTLANTVQMDRPFQLVRIGDTRAALIYTKTADYNTATLNNNFVTELDFSGLFAASPTGPTEVANSQYQMTGRYFCAETNSVWDGEAGYFVARDNHSLTTTNVSCNVLLTRLKHGEAATTVRSYSTADSKSDSSLLFNTAGIDMLITDEQATPAWFVDSGGKKVYGPYDQTTYLSDTFSGVWPAGTSEEQIGLFRGSTGGIGFIQPVATYVNWFVFGGVWTDDIGKTPGEGSHRIGQRSSVQI